MFITLSVLAALISGMFVASVVSAIAALKREDDDFRAMMERRKHSETDSKRSQSVDPHAGPMKTASNLMQTSSKKPARTLSGGFSFHSFQSVV